MKILLVVLLLLSQPAYSQWWAFKKIVTNTEATFRGLSVVDGHVAWMGGTKGTIGRSMDGGLNWKFVQVKNFEKADFRSVYAFDSLNAVIANAGVPAVILRTSDGGSNWKTVYTDDDTAVFFDGIDFWNNKDGVIYGDPINGRMLLLSTPDGGHSWKTLPKNSRPELEKGEASFAASGTGIRCVGNNKLIIVTGGTESRFFISEDRGVTWRFVQSPMIKGQSTTGIFSVAYQNDTAIVVGGDYKREAFSEHNVFVLQIKNDGFTWTEVLKPTRGYRECAEFISRNTVIAIGPTGADVSNDGGFNWKPLSDNKGMHVIRKSRKGNLVIAAGSNGNISLLEDGKK